MKWGEMHEQLTEVLSRMFHVCFQMRKMMIVSFRCCFVGLQHVPCYWMLVVVDSWCSLVRCGIHTNIINVNFKPFSTVTIVSVPELSVKEIVIWIVITLMHTVKIVSSLPSLKHQFAVTFRNTIKIDTILHQRHYP